MKLYRKTRKKNNKPKTRNKKQRVKRSKKKSKGGVKNKNKNIDYNGTIVKCNKLDNSLNCEIISKEEYYKDGQDKCRKPNNTVKPNEKEKNVANTQNKKEEKKEENVANTQNKKEEKKEKKKNYFSNFFNGLTNIAGELIYPSRGTRDFFDVAGVLVGGVNGLLNLWT